MDSPWDRLLDLLDHLAATPEDPLPDDLTATLGSLSAEAQADGTIDGELHQGDVTRWLTGLVAAHRAVRAAAPEVDPDEDLANLRVIVTRWLHPARPR